MAQNLKPKKYSTASTILTAVFVIVCLLWVTPILEVVINSFKSNNAINLDVFALPTAESFVGFGNYIKGLTFGNYPFLKSVGYSVFISVVSTFLILLFCSMAAWYIARVQSKFSNFFYYLCHKFVNHSVATSWAVVHGNIVHQLRLLIDEVLG